VYEPKFDGWRAMLFTAKGVVQSRRDNNLAARFPEIVAAARALGDVLVDGELVALREGRLDFGSLAAMPSTRAAAGVTVYFVAFDLLVSGADDLRALPFEERRARLADVFADAVPPLQLTPSTRDRDATAQWMRPEVADVGIEGVVAKAAGSRYRAGRTGEWIKTRQKVVVDAVVIGVAGAIGRPDSLLLARPDADGEWQPLGLSLPLSPAFRDEAAAHVQPTDEPRRRMPNFIMGNEGAEYQPVRPTLVVEVEADATVMTFSQRLRPRIHRFRPDLTPEDVVGSVTVWGDQ
jgi:ATP-dependent DNA ligase